MAMSGKKIVTIVVLVVLGGSTAFYVVTVRPFLQKKQKRGSDLKGDRAQIRDLMKMPDGQPSQDLVDSLRAENAVLAEERSGTVKFLNLALPELELSEESTKRVVDWMNTMQEARDQAGRRARQAGLKLGDASLWFHDSLPAAADVAELHRQLGVMLEIVNVAVESKLSGLDSVRFQEPYQGDQWSGMSFLGKDDITIQVTGDTGAVTRFVHGINNASYYFLVRSFTIDAADGRLGMTLEVETRYIRPEGKG